MPILKAKNISIHIDKKWKWAVAGILLLGVATVLFIYVFWTCCAPPPKSIPINSNGSDSDSILNDPNLLYAKRALIGLCRTKSGSGGSCHFNTYLYFSGKLIIESGELVVVEELGGEKATAYPTVQKELDKNLMDRITKQIRDSGVMTKPCIEDMVTDYYVDYLINLDGVKKQVQFPGCESEFNAIDKLIDVATASVPEERVITIIGDTQGSYGEDLRIGMEKGPRYGQYVEGVEEPTVVAKLFFYVRDKSEEDKAITVYIGQSFKIDRYLITVEDIMGGNPGSVSLRIIDTPADK